VFILSAFDLNSIATAVCLVSFDAIFFNILHQTMAYAALVCNNLECLWQKF
jgi:hypothetical protein